MKLRNIVIFVFTLLIVLCGCTNENGNTEQELTVYDLELYFYNEYTVSDLNNVIIYFPAVTNKKITSTELGGVGAKLNLKAASESNDDLKIALEPQNQDQINIKYNNYFISFLKYKLKVTDDFEINSYSSIDLNDTQLWVLCNEEIQPVNFIDNYLKIYITEDSEEQQSPNWNQQISKMMLDIQLKLNEN